MVFKFIGILGYTVYQVCSVINEITVRMAEMNNRNQMDLPTPGKKLVFFLHSFPQETQWPILETVKYWANDTMQEYTLPQKKRNLPLCIPFETECTLGCKHCQYS